MIFNQKPRGRLHSMPDPLDYAHPKTVQYGKAPTPVRLVFAPICATGFFLGLGLELFSVICLFGSVVGGVQMFFWGLIWMAVGAVLIWGSHILARFVESGWPQ